MQLQAQAERVGTSNAQATTISPSGRITFYPAQVTVTGRQARKTETALPSAGTSRSPGMQSRLPAPWTTTLSHAPGRTRVDDRRRTAMQHQRSPGDHFVLSGILAAHLEPPPN